MFMTVIVNVRYQDHMLCFVWNKSAYERDKYFVDRVYYCLTDMQIEIYTHTRRVLKQFGRNRIYYNEYFFFLNRINVSQFDAPTFYCCCFLRD